MRLSRLLYLLPALMAGFAFAATTPTITLDLDIQRTEQRQSLTLLQATTPRVEFRILQGAAPLRGLTGYTARLKYGSSLTPTEGWVAVDSSLTDVAASRIRFDFAQEDTNTNGTFKAVVQLLDGEGGIYYFGTLQLGILASTANIGAADLELGDTVDYTTVTAYTGVAADGPYRVGTNITFTANADGSRNINSKVVGTAAAGRILYGDATGVWQALGAGTSGQVLQSNGAAAPSWAAPGGVSDSDKGDIVVSGGGATWTIDAGAVTATKIGAGAVTAAKLADADFGAFTVSAGVATLNGGPYLPISGTAMTTALTLDYGPNDGGGIIFATDGPASPHIIGALAFQNADVAGGASAVEITGETNSTGDGGIFRVTTFPAGALALDGDAGTLTLTGAAYTGDGSGLTSLDATDLTGDIPAASFGAVRVSAGASAFVMTTSANVGYTTYELSTNSLACVAYKSATASQQAFTLRTAPIPVPRGFVAFKPTGALKVTFIADNATDTNAELQDINVYGYASDTGNRYVIYSSSTDYNLTTANVRRTISIDRSAFTSTTVPDQIVFEIGGAVANGYTLGVLKVEVISE